MAISISLLDLFYSKRVENMRLTILKVQRNICCSVFFLKEVHSPFCRSSVTISEIGV